jgi:hypothetical protein
MTAPDLPAGRAVEALKAMTRSSRELATRREMMARRAVADELIKLWPGIEVPYATAALLVRAAFDAAAQVQP